MLSGDDSSVVMDDDSDSDYEAEAIREEAQRAAQRARISDGLTRAERAALRRERMENANLMGNRNARGGRGRRAAAAAAAAATQSVGDGEGGVNRRRSRRATRRSYVVSSDDDSDDFFDARTTECVPACNAWTASDAAVALWFGVSSVCLVAACAVRAFSGFLVFAVVGGNTRRQCVRVWRDVVVA